MSIDELIDRYGAMVYRLAYLYTSDEGAAEDIRQEVFIAAYKHLASIQSPKSWLAKSTLNKARNYWRSRYRHPELRLENAEVIPDPALEALYEESEVLEAIKQLTQKYKEVILLYYYQGFSTREIADFLQISESAVRVRLSRARSQLQLNLKGVRKNETTS